MRASVFLPESSGMQTEPFLRGITSVIYGLSRSTIFFHIIPWNGIIVAAKKKKIVNIKCVFWFPLQLLSEIFLILQRRWQDININLYMSSCKVLLFLSHFIKNEFSG